MSIGSNWQYNILRVKIIMVFPSIWHTTTNNLLRYFRWISIKWCLNTCRNVFKALYCMYVYLFAYYRGENNVYWNHITILPYSRFCFFDNEIKRKNIHGFSENVVVFVCRKHDMYVSLIEKENMLTGFSFVFSSVTFIRSDCVCWIWHPA